MPDCTTDTLSDERRNIHNADLLQLQLSLSHKIGIDFFRATVTKLNALLCADFTLIGELRSDIHEIRTIAVCDGAGTIENFNYSLQDTPCDDVTKDGACVVKDNVAVNYPDDLLLQQMGIKGYVGIPIKNSAGQTVGIAVSLFKRPVEEPDFVTLAFSVMEQRIGAELERMKLEEVIREQRERYHFALHAGRIGLYDWNMTTNKALFNDRMFEIIGHRAEDFEPTYENWMSIVHPEDYSKVLAPSPTNEKDGKHYYEPTRYRVKTSAGHYKWMEVQSYVVAKGPQNTKHRIGIVKDVNDEVKVDQMLQLGREMEARLNRQVQQREELYSFALEVGNLGVYDWHLKENKGYFSPKLYNLFGWSHEKEAMTFETWLTHVHPHDLWQFTWQSFHQQRKDHRQTLHLFRVLGDDGQYRWMEAQNMVIDRDDEGHVVRMVGIVKDIDEEKRAADMLRTAFEKQRELNEELRIREEELTKSQSKLIANMSALKKLNKELSESESRWAYALEGNGDGVIECTMNEKRCVLSPRATEILGFAESEYTFSNFLSRIHPTVTQEFTGYFNLTQQPPFEPFQVEVQVRDQHDTYRWVLLRGKVVEVDEHEKPVKMVGTVTDITNQKVVEKELTIYEEMIKQNQAAIIFTSTSGSIEFVNETAIKTFEYQQHELIERNVYLLFPYGGSNDLLSENFRGQRLVTTKSGQQLIAQITTSLLTHDGDPIGYVINVIDITEKKNLEHQVTNLSLAKLEAELKAQREQTAMMLQVRENEKVALARELHDGIGQLLSLSKLQLEQLRNGLSPALCDTYRSLHELLHQVTAGIKDITSELMPLTIRNLELDSAITSMLEHYKKLMGQQVQVTSTIKLAGFELDPVRAIHVYRIAQEVVNNSMKYSGATSLTLMLAKLKNTLNLVIEDNGAGFDLPEQLNKKNSFGLKTMMERARLIKGKLLVSSSPKSGTSISLTIPINTDL